jgi:hypothetical protein
MYSQFVLGYAPLVYLQLLTLSFAELCVRGAQSPFRDFSKVLKSNDRYRHEYA